MMFVGGEEGIERELTAAVHLRTRLPDLAVGRSDYDAFTHDNEDVYGVVRSGTAGCCLVLVNLASEVQDVRGFLQDDLVPDQLDLAAVTDVYGTTPVRLERRGDVVEVSVVLGVGDTVVLPLHE